MQAREQESKYMYFLLLAMYFARKHAYCTVNSDACKFMSSGMKLVTNAGESIIFRVTFLSRKKFNFIDHTPFLQAATWKQFKRIQILTIYKKRFTTSHL